MYKVAEEKLATIKMAAFVDELVKCAAASGDPIGLDPFVEAFTPEQEELLKQAGLSDWLGAAKAGLGRAGSALAGAGQKAVGAVQNMGAGGAARRMAAAGAEHNALKPLMNSAYKAAPTAMQAQAAMPSMSHAISGAGARRMPYNPAAVEGGLMQQNAAHLNSLAAPKATGSVRYDPQAVSNHLSLSGIPGQSATMGAVPGGASIPAIRPTAPAMPAPRQQVPLFGSSLYPQAG